MGYAEQTGIYWISTKKILKSIIQNRTIFLLVLIFLISIFASILYDTFFTFENIKAVLLNMSIDAVVTIGMMLLLISGVFDLSVGSILGVSGAITAFFMGKLGFQPLPSALIALIICICIGAFNGIVIAKIGVNHFVVGLAMLVILRGAVLLIVGPGITRLSEKFSFVANSNFLGLDLPIWYMIFFTAGFSFLLKKSIFFRRYYYIGGNQKAASLSGIKVQRMRIISFMISGGLAGIAGIVLTSKLSASIPTLGTGLELRAVTACILGGASLAGGYGNIVGAVLGVLFMGLVNNLMIVSRAPITLQSIVISGILLVAVTLDALIKKAES